MPAIVLVNINLHITFVVPNFTRSKDMMGARKFKHGSRDPDHAHLYKIWRL